MRAYALDASGRPQANGRLIDGAGGNIGNWADVKAQAANVLGIQLVDRDITAVPLLLTDEYGRFLRGANGFPQMVTGVAADGTVTGVVEGGNLAGGGVPVPANAVRTGHAFLDDIAHNAAPARGPRPPSADSGCNHRSTPHLDAGLRRRAPRCALHHRRRPWQREHRPDCDPHHVPLGAQPPARRDLHHGRAGQRRNRGWIQGCRVGLRGAVVPGRSLRERDGVPARGLRGVRPQVLPGDRPLRGVQPAAHPGCSG